MHQIKRNYLVNDDGVGFAVSCDVVSEEATDELIPLETRQVAVDDGVLVTISAIVYVNAAFLVAIVTDADAELVEKARGGFYILSGQDGRTGDDVNATLALITA